MQKHETILVTFNEMEADIDVEIAPLILEIWRAGITTTFSCQGGRSGLAWIQFLTSGDAAQFLNSVVGPYDKDEDSLYSRIRHGRRTFYQPYDGHWIYEAHVQDNSTEFVRAGQGKGSLCEISYGTPELCFRYSVRFPRSDIPTLERRMRQMNERNSRPKVAVGGVG